MDSRSSSIDYGTASTPEARPDLSQDGSSVSTGSFVDGVEDAETEGGESANEENEEDQVANIGNEEDQVANKGNEGVKVEIEREREREGGRDVRSKSIVVI